MTSFLALRASVCVSNSPGMLFLFFSQSHAINTISVELLSHPLSIAPHLGFTGSGSTGSTPRPAVGASGECSRCCSAAAFSRGAASALSAFASRPAAASIPISGCRSPSASSKHATISSLWRSASSTSSAARMLARPDGPRDLTVAAASDLATHLPRWPRIMLRFASNRVTGGSLAFCGFLWLFARLSWLLPPSYYSLGFGTPLTGFFSPSCTKVQAPAGRAGFAAAHQPLHSVLLRLLIRIRQTFLGVVLAILLL